MNKKNSLLVKKETSFGHQPDYKLPSMAREISLTNGMQVDEALLPIGFDHGFQRRSLEFTCRLSPSPSSAINVEITGGDEIPTCPEDIPAFLRRLAELFERP